MSDVKFKSLILSGIAYAIISQIVHTLGAVISMSYYTDRAYSGVWSKLMMPSAGPPPIEFFIAAILLSFMTGVIFAYVYSMVGKSIAGKTTTDKGLRYGLILFLIGTFPGMASLFLLINLPTALIIMWTIEGLIVSLVSGIAIARIVK